MSASGLPGCRGRRSARQVNPARVTPSSPRAGSLRGRIGRGPGAAHYRPAVSRDETFTGEAPTVPGPLQQPGKGTGTNAHMAGRPPWGAATDAIFLAVLAVLAAVSSLPWLAEAERRIGESQRPQITGDPRAAALICSV